MGVSARTFRVGISRRNISLLAAAGIGLFGSLALVGDAKAPLVVGKYGWMYVGGKVVDLNGKQYMTDQMYVEYRLPVKKTHANPIIMAYSLGIYYTGTPDGREGWAQYFVRQGYDVYVVDQLGRGRSRYLGDNYGALMQPVMGDSLSRDLLPEKYNLWPQAHLHTQFPGTSTANDPVVEQMMEAESPGLQNARKAQEVNRDALLALVAKIGPSILMVHAQAGAYGWPVADAKPDLIKAILAVEPSGPPAHSVENVGAPSYFKYGGLSLPYGITSLPLNYSPAVASESELAFVQQNESDGPGMVKCFVQKEPARQLPNLQKVPILFITAEASYHAPYDHCTAKYLEQAGARPTLIRLESLGIHGNGHGMMFEKNNQEVAGVIARWLEENVDRAGSGKVRKSKTPLN